MKISLKNLYIHIFLFLIVVMAILDIFLSENDPRRYLAIYMQGLMLAMSMVYFFNTTIEKYYKPELLFLFMWAFISLLVIYAIPSQKLDRLPVFLYAITPFFIFFSAAYKNHIQEKSIFIFSVILFFIFSYETYLSVFDRMDQLKEFFYKADNVGYKSLSLMLLFSINLNSKKNIIFLTGTFLIVLMSFKRGAMLIGSFSYCIAMFHLLKGSNYLSRKFPKKIFFIALLFVSTLVGILVRYWDIFIYRFEADPTGSGRMTFYRLIFDGWNNGNFLNQLFGFGFFEVPNYLKNAMGWEIYAHSDWLQLLYDHGVFGVLIYLSLIISVISYYKITKIYRPDLYPLFVIILLVWLSKSIFAGNYINKDSIILFSSLGILFGSLYRTLNVARYRKAVFHNQ